MLRTFKIYSPDNLQMCNTVLLIIVTMLYLTSPGVFYNWKFVLFWPLHPHLPYGICLPILTYFTSIMSSRFIHVVANGNISFFFFNGKAWVWASSGRWWRTGKPGMLQSMGSQRVGPDWVTEQQQQYSIFYIYIYTWVSLVAQMVKNQPAMWETWARSLGWEDPLEEGMATHSSIFAWKIPMNKRAWWAANP